jgi:hypothetical protein
LDHHPTLAAGSESRFTPPAATHAES